MPYRKKHSKIKTGPSTLSEGNDRWVSHKKRISVMCTWAELAFRLVNNYSGYWRVFAQGIIVNDNGYSSQNITFMTKCYGSFLQNHPLQNNWLDSCNTWVKSETRHICYGSATIKQRIICIRHVFAVMLSAALFGVTFVWDEILIKRPNDIHHHIANRRNGMGFSNIYYI